MIRFCSWCLVAAVAAVAVGCFGRSGPAVEGEPYEELVMDLGDAAGKAADFKAMFADGVAVPEKDRKKYAAGFFQVESSDEGPEPDTMVMKVVFRDFENKVKGTAEWTAIKQGDNWKLKDAPLP